MIRYVCVSEYSDDGHKSGWQSCILVRYRLCLRISFCQLLSLARLLFPYMGGFKLVYHGSGLKIIPGHMTTLW